LAPFPGSSGQDIRIDDPARFSANNLGVARKTLSMLLNKHQGISAEMALRLAKAFNTTPELWMNMQRNYDLWNACQKVKLTR
jgi:antitoxin HigA-1